MISPTCRALVCMQGFFFFFEKSQETAALVYHSQGLQAINIHLLTHLKRYFKVNGLGQSMLVITSRR